LPLLEGALALAEKGHWSGGMKRNRRHLETTLGPRLSISDRLSAGLAGLLFESETSGGLLFAVTPERSANVLEEFQARGETCWEVGEVVPDSGLRVH
jgi:selenide, water dikinase